MKATTVSEVARFLFNEGFRMDERSKCYDRENPATGCQFRVAVTDEDSPGEYLRVEILWRQQSNWDYANLITLETACTLGMIQATVRLAFHSMTK